MNGRKNKFDRQMENFTEIRFSTAKFIRSVDVVVKVEGGERVGYYRRSPSGELRPFFDYGPKSEFLKAFCGLGVGKWKKRYYVRGVLSERKWELLIRFADGRAVRYSGVNAYPATFGELDRLLRADYAI